jgi:hypothetical protein
VALDICQEKLNCYTKVLSLPLHHWELGGFVCSIISFIGGKRGQLLILVRVAKIFWQCKPLRLHVKQSSALHPPDHLKLPSQIGSINSYVLSFKTGSDMKHTRQFDFKEAVEEAEE